MNISEDQDILVGHLESYALVKDKKSYLDTLVPESPPARIIGALHSLKVGKSDWEEVIKEWKMNPPYKGSDAYSVYMRYLLSSLFEAKSASAAKTILQSIDKLDSNLMPSLMAKNKPVMFTGGEEFVEDAENNLPSDLASAKSKKILLKDLLDMVYDNPYDMQNIISDELIYHLDLEKLAKKSIDVAERVLRQLQNYANIKVGKS